EQGREEARTETGNRASRIAIWINAQCRDRRRDMRPQMTIDLKRIARALGGEVSGQQVLAPGPGHSPRDRSLAVRPSATGLLVFSHAGDNWRECRDHVYRRLGLPLVGVPTLNASAHRGNEHERRQAEKAGWLWRQRQPIAGSIAERYLREARGYTGP